MWRNFSFLHMFHVQKFEISPHDRFFLHGPGPSARDKYQVWPAHLKIPFILPHSAFLASDYFALTAVLQAKAPIKTASLGQEYCTNTYKKEKIKMQRYTHIHKKQHTGTQKNKLAKLRRHASRVHFAKIHFG